MALKINQTESPSDPISLTDKLEINGVMYSTNIKYSDRATIKT